MNVSRRQQKNLHSLHSLSPFESPERAASWIFACSELPGTEETATVTLHVCPYADPEDNGRRGRRVAIFARNHRKQWAWGLVTLRFGSFPPASPLRTPEQDIALTKWLAPFLCSAKRFAFPVEAPHLPNVHAVVPEDQHFAPVLPIPVSDGHPRTSCRLRPYPASLASLRFDLLAKLTASSKSPQLQFLRAQNNYWHLLMHNILSCTWYPHCDFLLISMKVYWRQRPLLTLYRSSYLERWHILVPSRWFHVALNQAGLDSVGGAKFLWHSIRNGPSGMTLSQQSGLCFLKYLILQDSGNSTPS